MPYSICCGPARQLSVEAAEIAEAMNPGVLLLQRRRTILIRRAIFVSKAPRHRPWECLAIKRIPFRNKQDVTGVVLGEVIPSRKDFAADQLITEALGEVLVRRDRASEMDISVVEAGFN